MYPQFLKIRVLENSSKSFSRLTLFLYGNFISLLIFNFFFYFIGVDYYDREYYFSSFCFGDIGYYYDVGIYLFFLLFELFYLFFWKASLLSSLIPLNAKYW